MKKRFNKDSSYEYKMAFYGNGVLAIAHCLNMILGMVEENQKKGYKPFISQDELITIVDMGKKCKKLVSQLPEE